MEEFTTRPIPFMALALAALLLLMEAGASDGASEDLREVVLASEILAAIERGEPVDYDGVIVEGDLDLSGRSLGTVNFNRTIFFGSIDFENTNFRGNSWFRGSSFSGDASFLVAEFSGGDADFSFAEFLGRHADFSYANFSGGNVSFCRANFSGGDADFRGANFSGGDADFSDANFSGGDASFRRANFLGGDADFEYAEFSGGDADFSDANFSGGDADFSDAVFSGGNARFSDAIFSGGDASFSEAVFSGGDASFSFANFSGGNTRFSEAVFSGGDADFSGAVFFGGDANFKNGEFSGGDADFSFAEFFVGDTYFTNSWFKKDALFEYTIFEGTLHLNRAKYDKIFIRWDLIEGKLAYDDAAYLSLLKNFKELGYLEDYDYCYFEYRKERRNHPWPLVGKWEQAFRKKIDLLLELFYGYGTKPLNALFFSLGIIIGFGAFWRSIGLGRPDEALDEYTLPDAEHDGILEILSFSATVFLSGTRLFIEPPPLPKIGGRSRPLIRGAFIFERVLGALFSILFFLAISGTVVRQL